MSERLPNGMDTWGERFTQILTNVAKICGLVIGCRNVLVGPPDTAVLLYATAIFVGAQAFEDIILKLIDRTFRDGD